MGWVVITVPLLSTTINHNMFLLLTAKKNWKMFLQPMIYGRGPMPPGMRMVPMMLPDGRLGYVLWASSGFCPCKMTNPTWFLSFIRNTFFLLELFRQQPGAQPSPPPPPRRGDRSGGSSESGSRGSDGNRGRRYRPYWFGGYLTMLCMLNLLRGFASL